MHKVIIILKYVLVISILSRSILLSKEPDCIPIEVKYNRTLVTVQIDDIQIPDILLDTGFSFDGIIIYNPAYNDSLDISGAYEVEIPGAGDGEASKALMIDSTEFMVGNTKLVNQKIIILQGFTYQGFFSRGVMGYSIFGHYVTHLDYDMHTLTLYQEDENPADSIWTELPLYFKDNKIPWLDFSIVIKDEKPVPISGYIDLAAGDAIELLEKPDMKFSLPEEMKDAHLGTGLSGDIYGKIGKISKMILGPYRLYDVTAAIAPASTRSKQDNADAILGNDSLRRFNLIFDYANSKLFIKPNSDFLEPFD